MSFLQELVYIRDWYYHRFTIAIGVVTEKVRKGLFHEIFMQTIWFIFVIL